MQLVFYSNYAGRLVLGAGQASYWNTEVYPVESIKEFEKISLAWQRVLARMLKKGFLECDLCVFISAHDKHNETRNELIKLIFLSPCRRRRVADFRQIFSLPQMLRSGADLGETRRV
jgi:hypothetical protein